MTWDELKLILQRPIAFHRIFAEVGGGALNGLFLSQAFYWTKITKDPDGWFWKTREEWFLETGMDRKEQEEARRALKYRGIIEEQKRGIPCRVWFRINRNKLIGLIESIHTTYSVSDRSVGDQSANQLGRFEDHENEDVTIRDSIEKPIQTCRDTVPQQVGNQSSNLLDTSLPTNTETTTETTHKDKEKITPESSIQEILKPKRGRPKKETNPDVKKFVDWWHNEYISRFNSKYMFEGRDFREVSVMLQAYGYDKLVDLAIKFFDCKNDCWVIKKGYSIGSFKSKILAIAAGLDRRIDGQQNFFGQSKGSRVLNLSEELQKGFEERSPTD